MISLLFPAVALCFTATAAEGTIPAGSKIYIAPMGGFETYVKAAIEKKKVAVVIVEQRDAAEFEISGAAESEKASTAKKIIRLDWHSKEQASIKVSNIQSSEVTFAYSVHKESSAHGKQSSAEACAKHLKEAIRISMK
jgi:hypothetical protein